MTTMKREIAAVFLVGGIAGVAIGAAVAQEQITAAQATARTERALATVEPTLSCLQSKHRALQTNLRLIREAEAQRSSPGASPNVRRDAEQTIRALHDQAEQLEIQARGCLGATTAQTTVSAQRTGSGTSVVATTRESTTTAAAVPGIPPGSRTRRERDAQGREVIVVEPPPDPVAETVAQNAPAIEVVERDAALTPSVRVLVAERVDGDGRVSNAAVAAAVRRIAPRIDGCYYDYLRRRPSARDGQAVLAFSVNARGRIREAAVESATLGDSTMNGCLRSALQSLQIPAPGNDFATFSYTLRFGAAR